MRENFGILEGGAGETERSPDCLLESRLPLSARVIALSSSARQAPTGILLGVMGRRSTSCSLFLTCKYKCKANEIVIKYFHSVNTYPFIKGSLNLDNIMYYSGGLPCLKVQII